MKKQINTLTRRALHNADAAYYVLDHLAHSFPTQLYEPFTDSEGNLASRPVARDGQPVDCRDAARRRDALIEKLASLPPVPGALDQIVQRFGIEGVAEVTGRSRRVIAFEAVRRINVLFDVERGINGLPPQDRLEARQRLSTPLIEDLQSWLERFAFHLTQGHRKSPGSWGEF